MSGGVRPYQPVTPANNKYLAKRWDQEIFNTHRQKVAAAKAVIDNNPPTVHMHLHIKLKKLQFEAERLATIERDNRILLEKMAHIMRTGGLVDHKKHDYAHKSLNKTKRQRELLRITHENLAILKRLTTKDPHYNHKKWLLEWQVNQQYLMNISKYPHRWRQEQSPYISMVQRQTKANKQINEKVHSNQVGGVKAKESKSTEKAKISVSDTSPLVPSAGSNKSTPQPFNIDIKQEPDDTPEKDGKRPKPVEIKIEPESVEIKIEPELDFTTIKVESPEVVKPVIPTLQIEDDVTSDVNEEEKMAHIPITISQSDYQQAVNVDLPRIETPASSPETPPDI